MYSEGAGVCQLGPWLQTSTSIPSANSVENGTTRTLGVSQVSIIITPPHSMRVFSAYSVI